MPSINGFLCSNDRAAIGVKTFVVPGTGALPGRSQVRVALRADVAPLLLEFARWWHAEIEPLDVGQLDDWGYAARNVRGSTSPSFHWAGIAIDLNALKHPLGRRGTVTAAQHARIVAKANTLGLRWGGTYSSRADEMHAEVIVPLARALQLVRALQSPAAAAPAPAPAGGRGDAQVRALQTATRIPPAQRDGVWGPQTDGAINLVRDAVRGHFPDVRAAQAVVGTPVDGQWGPASQRALTATVRAIQAALNVPVDGDWGPQTDRGWAAARGRHYRG